MRMGSCPSIRRKTRLTLALLQRIGLPPVRCRPSIGTYLRRRRKISRPESQPPARRAASRRLQRPRPHLQVMPCPLCPLSLRKRIGKARLSLLSRPNPRGGANRKVKGKGRGRGGKAFGRGGRGGKGRGRAGGRGATQWKSRKVRGSLRMMLAQECTVAAPCLG